MDEIEMLKEEIEFLEFEKVKLNEIRKIVNSCIINTNVYDNNFVRLAVIREELDIVDVKNDIEIRKVKDKVDLLLG